MRKMRQSAAYRAPRSEVGEKGGLAREKELWFLVAVAILFFHRELFFSETAFIRDLCSYFLPQRQLLVEQLRSAVLPLWNPYIQGGQAFLPSVANSLLVPSNLLYLVLPPVRALNAVIALHLMLCLVSCYALARVLGLRPAAALVSGLAFGLSGPVLSLVNLLNHFIALSFLPLLALFWHLFLSERRHCWLQATVLVGVFQVFAGSPEINVISLLFLLGWTLIFPFQAISPGRRFGFWFILAILILGASAVQLLPTAEIAAESPRGFGIEHENLTRWSLHPKRAPEVVLPSLLGHVDTLDQEAYWGGALIDTNFPYLISIYLGCTVLLLCIPACLFRAAPLPRRFRLFLMTAGLGLAVLACGRHIWLVDLLLQHLPFVEIFRYPSKFLVGSVLPLALLAGSGSQFLFGDQTSVRKWSGPAAGIMLALAGGFTLSLILCWSLLTTSDAAGMAAARWLFGSGAGEAAVAGMASSLLHAFGVAIPIVGLLVLGRRLAKPWLQTMVVAIVLVDLVTAGLRVVPSAPDALVTDPVETAGLITDEIGDGRLYRTKIPDGARISAPSDHIAWKFRWILELYGGWSPISAGIPRIFDPDLLQLSPLPLMRLKYALEDLPWSRKAAVLGAAGVTLVLTELEVDSPLLEKIADYPNRSNQPYVLYRNRAAVAPVRLATTWQSFTSEDDVLLAMVGPAYDPRKTALILDDAGREHSGPADQGASTIRCMNSKPHLAVYEVQAAHDGYLVFSQPFYPGWKVEIDGRPAPVVRADFAFSAVFLEAGHHVVRRSYLPKSLLFGGLISALFAVFILLGPIFLRSSGPSSREPRSATESNSEA